MTNAQVITIVQSVFTARPTETALGIEAHHYHHNQSNTLTLRTNNCSTLIKYN